MKTRYTISTKGPFDPAKHIPAQFDRLSVEEIVAEHHAAIMAETTAQCPPEEVEP